MILIPTFEQCGFTRQKDADGMAKSMDPDQTAPSGTDQTAPSV